MIDVAPYLQCINHVHPAMIQKIISIESGNNPFAININKTAGRTPKYKKPTTKSEAINLATYYVSRGYSVDLGYMQINSRNLKHYGVTITDMFNPCKNIHIGSTLLYHAYQRAMKTTKHPQMALRYALSIYNTGNIHRGFKNGYVEKYTQLPHKQKPSTHSIVTISTKHLYD